MDRERAIRKVIARMIVDDGDESAQTGGVAKVAVCMYVRRAEAKIEIESVQLRCCSVHTNTYMNIYSARKITTAVAWLKAGFFISTHTLFCVVGVVCVRCNKQTHFVLGSIFRHTVV